jgi:hypothetical protein
MLHLDEPVGFRYANNTRQAALALWLVAVFSVGAIAWMIEILKG